MEVKPANTCLIGLGVEVMYTDTPNPQFPCRGNHRCDSAIFDVKLNGVVIGTANLNNGTRGGDVAPRKIIVSAKLAEQIANNSKDNLLTLSLQCKTTSNCHSATPEIRITKDNQVIIHTCTSLLNRGDNREMVVLVLDLCGNIIGSKNQPPNAGKIDTASTLAAQYRANQSDSTGKTIYVYSKDGKTASMETLNTIIGKKLIVLDPSTKKYKWTGPTMTTISSKNSQYKTQTINKGDTVEIKPTMTAGVLNDKLTDLNTKYTELYDSGKVIKQSLGSGLPEQYIWVDKETPLSTILPGNNQSNVAKLSPGMALNLRTVIKAPSF
jgi:hypothetical protein